MRSVSSRNLDSKRAFPSTIQAILGNQLGRSGYDSRDHRYTWTSIPKLRNVHSLSLKTDLCAFRNTTLGLHSRALHHIYKYYVLDFWLLCFRCVPAADAWELLLSSKNRHYRQDSSSWFQRESHSYLNWFEFCGAWAPPRNLFLSSKPRPRWLHACDVRNFRNMPSEAILRRVSFWCRSQTSVVLICWPLLLGFWCIGPLQIEWWFNE